MNGIYVTVKNCVIQDNMKYNDEMVLTYKIEYPQFSSMYYKKSLNTINRYYLNMAMEIQKYYIKELYKSAVEQYIYSKQNDFPIRVYEGLVQYQVTYNMACILSLYFDNYMYLGGAHGNTVRTSETWNLQTNNRIMLGELFECSLDYKTYILNQVIEEIKKDPSIYFEDYEKLALETLAVQNFYCISKGIVIYFQQYDIAPYSSGIREFLIPYTDCVVNPFKKCKIKFD
ncbi:MAG: DUF3298 and DUF4163 domain-containing protein [Aminipila sp.]